MNHINHFKTFKLIRANLHIILVLNKTKLILDMNHSVRQYCSLIFKWRLVSAPHKQNTVRNTWFSVFRTNHKLRLQSKVTETLMHWRWHINTHVPPECFKWHISLQPREQQNKPWLILTSMLSCTEYYVCSLVCSFLVAIKTDSPKDSLLPTPNTMKTCWEGEPDRQANMCIIFELAPYKCRIECTFSYSLTKHSVMQGGTTVKCCKMFVLFRSPFSPKLRACQQRWLWILNPLWLTQFLFIRPFHLVLVLLVNILWSQLHLWCSSTWLVPSQIH